MECGIGSAGISSCAVSSGRVGPQPGLPGPRCTVECTVELTNKGNAARHLHMCTLTVRRNLEYSQPGAYSCQSRPPSWDL